MKIWLILLLFSFALLLTSCGEGPDGYVDYETYFCRINIDGTGYETLSNYGAFGDVYDFTFTQDGEIIYCSDRYYITNPDSIRFFEFPEALIGYPSGLTLSNDNKAYFQMNGDIYRYDLLSHSQTNLTINDDTKVSFPNISSDNRIITLLSKQMQSSNSYGLCYYDLTGDSLHIIPEAGTNVHNGAYNPLDNKLYYEQNGGLYKINLDGTDNMNIVNYNYGYRGFGLTLGNDHLASVDYGDTLRIIDLDSFSIEFQIHLNGYPNMLPIKIAKNSNKVFYTKDGFLYYYDIDIQTAVKIPNVIGLEYMMSPTWDGNKIYYYSTIRIN